MIFEDVEMKTNKKFPLAVAYLKKTGLSVDQALEHTEKELKKQEGIR